MQIGFVVLACFLAVVVVGIRVVGKSASNGSTARNKLLGIRTPLTLSSDKAWREIHGRFVRAWTWMSFPLLALCVALAIAAILGLGVVDIIAYTTEGALIVAIFAASFAAGAFKPKPSWGRGH